MEPGESTASTVSSLRLARRRQGLEARRASTTFSILALTLFHSGLIDKKAEFCDWLTKNKEPSSCEMSWC